MERPNLPRWIEPVNAPDLIAVRVVEYRRIAVFLFEAFAIQLHLLATFLRPDGRLLRLDDGQRLQVAPIKHVVAESLARVVGHPLDLDFNTRLAGEHRPLGFKDIPSSLLKIDINVGASRLRLGNARLRHPWLSCHPATAAIQLRIHHPKKICADLGGKLRMSTLHLALVFGVHSEDAHKLQIAQTVVVGYELTNRRVGEQFQERRLGRHLRTLALVDFANAVTNGSPTRNSRSRRVFLPGHIGNLPYKVFDCHVGIPCLRFYAINRLCEILTLLWFTSAYCMVVSIFE